MELYPQAPPTFPISNAEHDEPLGLYLPAEIVNQVYSLILKSDSTGVVLPSPIAPVEVPSSGHNGRVHGLYIVSSCPLLRTCKASRAAYHALLRYDMLHSGYTNRQVLVKDFDFSSVVHGLINRVTAEHEKEPNGSLTALKQCHFTRTLVFTEDFLWNTGCKMDEDPMANPQRDRFNEWLAYNDDDIKDVREWNFTYGIEPFSIRYFDDLRKFINTFLYERRGAIGPELRAFREAMMTAFEDGRCIKEGCDVAVNRKWIKGRWVVWPLDGSAEEPDSERESDDDEPIVRYDPPVAPQVETRSMRKKQKTKRLR